MTFTADYPITVDGVRLDTLAWNIAEINMGVAGTRNRDVVIPGVDGQVPSLNDDREEAYIGLEMLVRGTDADGLIPAGRESLSVLRDNLDDLTHLFGTRHRLIDYRRQTKEDGTYRRAYVKVTDQIEPKLTPGSSATFSVAFVIPAGMWESTEAITWSQTAPTTGTTYTVTGLDGSTERIADGIYAITGPANSGVRLEDANTGQWVQLNTAIPAGQVWRINAATWVSRMGAALTTASLDTDGTDQSALTTWGGAGTSFLALQPTRSATWTRHCQLKLTAGGLTGASKIDVLALRKYRL